MSENDTIEQKLYQAHELLKEVLLCLDINDPLHYDLFTAQNYIFLVGRNLPRNLLAYRPKRKA